MLGLPHKSAACHFGAEDHCFGCQLVGCGFYDCPLALRNGCAQRWQRDKLLFSSFEMVIKTFHVVFQAPNISSFAECDRSLVSLIFDRCGRAQHLTILDPLISLEPRFWRQFWQPFSYSNRESYDGDPSHQATKPPPSTRPNGSQWIPMDPSSPRMTPSGSGQACSGAR